MRTGPDRSSDHGPKTVRTGLRTGPGPVFSRTDPSLPVESIIELIQVVKRAEKQNEYFVNIYMF